MSERKHTPGPWLAAAKPSSVVGWPVIAPRSPSAMSVCNVHAGHDYSEGNARLIAAAPDLLEACRQAAIQFRFYEQQHLAKRTPEADAKALRNHEMAKICETAIAKAEIEQLDRSEPSA